MNKQEIDRQTLIDWVHFCGQKLIELEKVKPEQVQYKKWHLKFDREKLTKRKLAGYVSMNRDNTPVLCLSPDLTGNSLVQVIAHESIHLIQVFRGDVFYGVGYTSWKGKKYKSLPAEHPDYRNQPWEKEAFELAPILYQYLRQYSEEK